MLPPSGAPPQWCEFLKEGDQVDLVPASVLAALHAAGGRVYGISRAGRPLGAEPEVVGTWMWRGTVGRQMREGVGLDLEEAQ